MAVLAAAGKSPANQDLCSIRFQIVEVEDQGRMRKALQKPQQIVWRQRGRHVVAQRVGVDQTVAQDRRVP